MTNVVLPKDGPGNHLQGWTQTDKSAHVSMWKLGLKAPAALAVLHFMISKINRGANGIVISAPALARQMGISERTAKTAVGILREAKFVQVLKSGNTNVYIVNSKVSWSGNRQMRYASFNAQIVVDEQEQGRALEEILQEAEELIDVPAMEMEIDMDALDKTLEGQVKEKPEQKGLLDE